MIEAFTVALYVVNQLALNKEAFCVHKGSPAPATALIAFVTDWLFERM